MRNFYPLNTRHVFIPLVLFVALAVGFLLLFPGGFAQAQDASNIPYQENGTGPVTTFTATDPEGGTIYWSVLPEDTDVNNIEGLDANDDADSGDFSISAGGVLTFNIPPDYESPDTGTLGDNEYNIVVVASDDAPGADDTDGNGSITPPEVASNKAYKKVVVTVTDVDEPGIVTLSSLQPQVGTSLMATLDDPEETRDINNASEAKWKWEKSQDMSSWTVIDSVDAAMRAPDATTTGSYLRATATYDDSFGNGKTAQGVSVNKVRAAPTTADADSEFPPTNARDVAENSPAGTNVGDPVKATDSADDVLTYSLTGANSGGFQINPATGQITVGPRTILDADDTVRYTVMVRATEAGAVEDGTVARTADPSATVEITVTDVNEAPMVTRGATMLEKAEDDADILTVDAGILTVSTYTALDPEDSAVVAWSLQGADAGKFSIVSTTGVLTFNDAPNYEMPADAGRNNVYNVTVVATDAGVDGKNKMTATRAVTIKVTNVEENGTVILSAQQPYVGAALTASVTDLDGPVTDVTWKWERDNDETDDPENDTAGEAVIEGATSATYTPTSADAGSFLRAIASYTDPQGKGMFDKTSVAAVLARTDNAPKFADAESGKRFIAENQDAVAPVVAASNGTTVDAADDPVLATDTDASQLLTYRLSGADAGSFTIMSDTGTTAQDRGGQISTKAKLDYETKSTYRVTVTATDSDNLSASINVTIMVIDMNDAPEVTGDAEKDYPENQTRDVATYRATDPEDGTIYWSLLLANTGSPEDLDATLTDADDADESYFTISAGGVLSFNAPPDYEMPRGMAFAADSNTNTYKVVVVASDDAPGAVVNDQKAYKKVTITVTDMPEPGIVTLSSLQPQVGTALTATLADPEVDSPDHTWKWEQSRSRTSGWTAIGGGIAAELMPDATTTGNYLRATATYKDADDNDRTPQAVSVNRVRAAPATMDATRAEFDTPSDVNDRSVAENSPAETNVGDPVKANDTADEVLTYSLGGANAASFEINPASGQITVGPRTILDHEAMSSYTVTVTVTEAGGATADQPVTIMVRDVNEAPTMTEGVTKLTKAEDDADITTDDTTALTVSTYAATDPEDGTVTLSLEGADAGKFNIVGGALTFKEAPNYEMPEDAGNNNEYNVTVVATDNGVDRGDDNGGFDNKNKMTAKREVTIMVTNEDENGTVTLSAQQPKVGVPITASVDDPDDGVTDITWQWYGDVIALDLDPGKTGKVDETMIDENESAIAGATSATYTPTAADADPNGDGTFTDARMLRVLARYKDGKGNDNVVGSAVTVVAFRTDNAPTFGDLESGKRSIDEGTYATATDVGAPVRAMDLDTTQLLTYRLSGADAGSFSIESDSSPDAMDRGGQITVKAGTKLDYETKSTYMVTVTAIDPGGLSASIDVTIKVTDVNEAPEILVGGLAISGSVPAPYEENGTGPVATYRAIGSNAASATWALSGADAGDFRISSSGVLSFPRSPNYEAPADADTDNVYQVTVRASDRRYNAMLAVTVRVTDVFEAPFVPSAPNVLPTVGEPTSLDVSWRAPSNGGGPDITSYDLQYRISGSGNFIDGPQNVTGTSTTITGLTEDTSYEVQVRATNDEGDSDWSTAGMGSTGTSSNNAPIFPDATLTRSVMENTEADTNVGGVIPAATDADRGDTLTYTMEGTDAASFAFDASTRQIKTLLALVYETKSSYSVTINVSDGTDSDTVAVTITVIDVNEALTPISGPSNTDYAENRTDGVATFISMDPEGATISWTLEGTDADVFDISSGGVLTFKSSPDYEMAADANTDNIYMITVNASDGTNMATTLAVTITVTDVEEMAPEMSLLERYDDDDSGHIDRAEAVRAVLEYQSGQLTRGDAVQVILLYQAGPQ